MEEEIIWQSLEISMVAEGEGSNSGGDCICSGG